ncbi:unnamed protein product [Lactuca virosa]|uniref:ATP-dependent DNA helicase n=1 Tax=Lactuca virosa TaxID=75947 RepID=A0AAU9M2G7_9ASTR|nr:unnamed protein product [Lactuca virosa]
MKLRLIGRRDRDARTYNLPTVSEVAALIVGDICDSVEKRDIVVETKTGFLQCINELHPSYLPLQYPLLFYIWDDGYSVDILHRVVYTIEYQKRGLTHSHICLFMHSGYKLPTVEFIDPIISAEIPDKIVDPELYSLVNEFMIHGPCGAMNMNCPCMVEKKFSKNFPKQFFHHTSVNQNGFPLYRRRNDGHFVEKSGVKLDNRNVVPYNKYLLKRYQTHVNVEWCNQGSSIKYMFKYINKGPDRTTFVVVQTNNECENNDVVDEIVEYYDCRYLSACEASWGIFKYDVHYRPEAVWENTWEYLADGILYNQQQRFKSPDLSLSEDELKNLTLFQIKQILLRNNSTLKKFTKMPYPDVKSVCSSNNRLITEELDYNIPIIKNEFDSMFVALTNEQRDIFLDIMSVVKENQGGVLFVYGYGGTGKTFLWKTISTAVRSDGHIVLNVSSSGIASLLLSGGRTTHSRFIHPFELTEDSVSRINPDSELATLLRKTSLIIWDEAPKRLKHKYDPHANVHVPVAMGYSKSGINSLTGNLNGIPQLRSST